MQLPEWIGEVVATLPSPFTGKLEINCVEDGVADVNVIVNRKYRAKKILDKYQRIIVAVKQEL